MAENLLRLDKLLAKAADAKTVAEGTMIFVRGAEGHAMYVVLEGAVELRVGDTVLDTARPGDVFGEMALVDGSPRSATAVAMEETRLAPLDEGTFLDMVEDTPFFALHVMRTLAKRVRRLTQRLQSLVDDD